MDIQLNDLLYDRDGVQKNAQDTASGPVRIVSESVDLSVSDLYLEITVTSELFEPGSFFYD